MIICATCNAQLDSIPGSSRVPTHTNEITEATCSGTGQDGKEPTVRQLREWKKRKGNSPPTAPGPVRLTFKYTIAGQFTMSVPARLAALLDKEDVPILPGDLPEGMEDDFLDRLQSDVPDGQIEIVEITEPPAASREA